MKLSIERAKAVNGFQPKRIRAPPKTPRKSEMSTSLKISARPMAISGGRIDSQPGSTRSSSSVAAPPPEMRSWWRPLGRSSAVDRHLVGALGEGQLGPPAGGGQLQLDRLVLRPARRR